MKKAIYLSLSLLAIGVGFVSCMSMDPSTCEPQCMSCEDVECRQTFQEKYFTPEGDSYMKDYDFGESSENDSE